MIGLKLLIGKNALCCCILTKAFDMGAGTHKEQCIHFTGVVAPLSLCLVGYIQSVQPKSVAMIGFLAVLSLIMYIMVLFQLLKYLKMPFFPSYSAFTFPFVINAIGMKMTMAYLANIGYPIPLINYLVILQTIIATILVVYTLARFIMFIFATEKKTDATA